jgi:drug/metabolite transporter (DMT)-like permease
MTARPKVLPAVLLAAILGISVSGPLARLAEAEPLAIAVWRLILALSVIGAMLLATGAWREWRQLTRHDVMMASGAGVLLAVHFWSWIASLGMTSVAASVLLVNLHPVVIVAGSIWWLNERPTRGQLLGLGVALLGAMLIGFGGVSASRDVAMGNALAVVGAVTVGLYYLAGRSLRQRLSLWPYVGLVYGACLVALLGFALARGTTLTGFSPRAWMLFGGIALGPMLLGHTGFNWALRYVPAYVVSLAVLAEPVGASLLAYLLPGIRETPSMSEIVGGAVVLLGLGIGSVSPRSADPSLPTEGPPLDSIQRHPRTVVSDSE